MAREVSSFTLDNLMKPIGPYAHFTKAGDLISISAIAGVDPETQKLAGDDISSQTKQVIRSMETMLAAAGSDLDHILHINIFLTDMANFAAMNAAYTAELGGRTPARSVVAVTALPKPGALVTMNLTAVEAC